MARIEAQDFARMEKSATEKIKARNRAEALIKDAIARYIKEKTRAVRRGSKATRRDARRLQSLEERMGKILPWR